MHADGGLHVGMLVEDYRLLSVLGTGGTSTVYVAQSVDHPQTLVAVKVLSYHEAVGAADRSSFRARFLREARAVSRLHHKHILPVLSYGESDDLTYMVLPLVAGGPLAGWLADQHAPIPLPIVADYATKLASALDYAHQQGLVHRDVKPSNVLVGPHGRIYLTDFGIARLFEAGENALTRAGPTTLTRSGQMVGTPHYMAPEQIMGEPVGPTTDIYAFGVLLYQMVTGRLPFQGEMPLTVAIQHLHEMPPSPRLLRPELPAAAEASILRALAKPPSERFASAGELARDFAAGVMGRPVPVAVPDDVYATRDARGSFGAPLGRHAIAATAAAPPPGPAPALDSTMPRAAVTGDAASRGAGVRLDTRGAGVRVALEQDLLIIRAGVPVLVKVVLANTGGAREHVRAVVEGIPERWVQGPSFEVLLKPGSQETVPLIVNAPEPAGGQPEEYQVTVRAVARGHADASGAATARWIILPFGGADLRIQPLQVSGRTQASYTVELRNGAERAAHYTLSPDDGDRALTYQFAQNPVRLDPDGSTSVRLTITTPIHWAGGRLYRPIRVRAVPSSDDAAIAAAVAAPAAAPASATAQFVHVPVFPAWLVRAVVVFAPIGLIAILLFSAIRPVPALCPLFCPTSSGGSGAWQRVADLPTARLALAGGVGSDGRIYAFGGTQGSGANPVFLDSVDVYTPATKTWTSGAPLLAPRSSMASVSMPDGHIWIIGGKDSNAFLSSVLIYDPSTQSWSHGASMRFARGSAAAVLMPDGRIYVFGGRSTGSMLLDSVEEYTPATESWAVVAHLPGARYRLRAVLLGDRIYVLGGEDGNGTALNAVDVFKPATNTWEKGPAMLSPRSHPAAAVGPDNRIYVFGGKDRNGKYLNTVERYDPQTNAWALMAPMPTPRSGMVAVVGRDHLIYVIGGNNTAADLATVEAFSVSG